MLQLIARPEPLNDVQRLLLFDCRSKLGGAGVEGLKVSLLFSIAASCEVLRIIRSRTTYNVCSVRKHRVFLLGLGLHIALHSILCSVCIQFVECKDLSKVLK